MRSILALISLLSFLGTWIEVAQGQRNLDAEAKRVLEAFELSLIPIKSASQNAEWNYNTNINLDNRDKLTKAQVEEAEVERTVCRVVSALVQNENDIQNLTLRRWVHETKLGCDLSVGTGWRTERISQLTNELTGQYSTAKVIIDGKECSLDPELTEILATSRDFNKLYKAWTGWYDTAPRKMKPLYIDLVQNLNSKAKDSGFNNEGESWRAMYEHLPAENFERDMENIMTELRPMYEQLHAYVREKLRKHYSNRGDYFPSSGHIPMHLLGNMWAQQWNNIYSLTVPFPEKPTLDVTQTMVNQGYTAMKMFVMSDDFFKSLGFQPMPQIFWEKSVLEKPVDREIVCHASAWNFYFPIKDVRIKMCTKIRMDDFITVHHEMGHIQYFLEYQHLGAKLQESANPGFHEAVGDTISLAVTTQKHMKEVGLITSIDSSQEMKINYLFLKALSKIVFLPFGYLVDKWRWRVFDGSIKPEDYNNEWWKLVCKYQGTYPPSTRSTDGFDPGAKFHVPANSKYMSYFISFIVQFQLYKSMCEKASHSGDLFECDFYKSEAAGAPLRRMLAYGLSKHWMEQLKEFTGDDNYNTAAIKEYFKPLTEWLKQENQKNGVKVGWEDTCPKAPTFIENGSQRSVGSATILVTALTFLGVIVRHSFF